MPMARVKNSGFSVDHDGKTYAVGTVFTELPQGVIDKLKKCVPHEVELLHKEPLPPVAPPVRKRDDT